MQSHIHQWGNSLGIRIPKKIAKQLHLHSGSAVEIKIEDDRIIIQSPKYDLERMLKDITLSNQQHQIFDDQQLGSEQW